MLTAFPWINNQYLLHTQTSLHVFEKCVVLIGCWNTTTVIWCMPVQLGKDFFSLCNLFEYKTTVIWSMPVQLGKDFFPLCNLLWVQTCNVFPHILGASFLCYAKEFVGFIRFLFVLTCLALKSYTNKLRILRHNKSCWLQDPRNPYFFQIYWKLFYPF